MPFPDFKLSPGNHVCVDKRAFTRNTHVTVKLELLGYDTSLWGGLTKFRGLVVNRYYQQVTGCSMFSVDFGRSIGVREVKVCDTKKDPQREGTFLPRQSLFGSTSTSPKETSIINGDGHMNPAGKYDWARPLLHNIHVNLALVCALAVPLLMTYA